IGGNSGSPMINKNLEAVGLAFDGNMESLPGEFIFVPDLNRTISVHTGGIVAAMRYIYKADRLVSELTGTAGSAPTATPKTTKK
ncbi:MAG: S46 family peptidase, partial [Cytophagaceae bacterium]